MDSFAQLSKDSIQSLFPIGNFVSFKDNIACYRLKGIKDGGMYGYCKYNPNFRSNFSGKSTSWNREKGEVSKFLNSPCYTIIAPIYDHALPFSQGWAPVCINKKWSYVSLNGDYLFDFILDAAYPFKNDIAKVVYDGQAFEINLKGEGLPKEAYSATNELTLTLLSETINQLHEESQYDIALSRGKDSFQVLTTSHDGNLPELSAMALTSTIKIAYATMGAQNSMMSLTGSRFREQFDFYRTQPVNRCMSYESRHPSLNMLNAEYYFSAFRSSYSKECSAIILEIERLDYKSAILMFEQWIDEKNIKVQEDLTLLMTYYYLAELSDDFETANEQLINISNYYEANKSQLEIEDYSLGILLADIKRYQSADLVFNKLKTRSNKLPVKEFGLFYNNALMYKSANKVRESIDLFQKALHAELPMKYIELKLECMSDLIHLQLAEGIIDKTLLENYVNTEIDFNTNILEIDNSLIVNRKWGNSIQRMQRLFEYLGKLNNITFLQSAYALSVFLQGITFDAEKYLTKTVFALNNTSMENQFKEFLEQRALFKGVDVFDMVSMDDTAKEEIYNLYQKEEIIKHEIIKRQKHFIPTNQYKAINSKNSLQKNIIDIVQYKDECNLFRNGAFTISSNGMISFVPLSIYDEFSSEDFWSKINLSQRFSPKDDIYVYYGVLDTLGLEYHKTVSGEIPYTTYRLHRCSSLSNALTVDNNLFSNNNVILYGGLEYGDSLVASSRGADKGYLEYSETEIDAIGEILEKTGKDVVYKKDAEGTLESFRKISYHSPRIIHLATHGYSNKKTHEYNPLEDRFNYYRQNTDIQQKEWLMNNTGLFMSLDSIGNNIMYANIVASCDLSETELVVLSACSTISGEHSDGNTQTIGLTTAFSLASAQNIITSLRDVNDEKTCEFMTMFYQQYANSNTLYESFRNTVFIMKQKYPNESHFWSSFVLVEN